MDTSEIGRYGTVSFMKRLEPDKVVAAFPIDEEQVTFGRDPRCHVRLYYNSISPIHCKIIFQERKAFLVVLGTNGVVIDGCRVFPSTSSPTTIPLTNNSEIEIHSKRFRFTYPPKELRAVLLATPARASPAGTPFRRRALRMSMIQSAQVFSPRPSAKPMQNLHVLQSPIKPFKTPRKESATGTQNDSDNESDDDQEIVLVDGDSPIVVEEEKDLVILENVEVEDDDTNEEQLKTPTRQTYTSAHVQSSVFRRLSQPPLALQTPPRQSLLQTPKQRGQGSLLHRAVLIRSAQRAVMQSEIEKEEVEEEKEVEEFIAPGDRQGSECSTTSSEGESGGEEEGTEQEEEDLAMSNWRHRFAAIDISSAVPGQHEEEIDITDVAITVEPATDRDEQIAQALETISGRKSPQLAEDDSVTRTPTLPRTSTNFSTPQVNRVAKRTQAPGRYSYGGVGLDNGVRRVVVEQTWRVKDIVLPENIPTIKEEQEDKQDQEIRWNLSGAETEKRRPPVSDEERKAIRERRRSALKTPDAFFGGQAPGMRRLSSVPLGATGRDGNPFSPSPKKNTTLGFREPSAVKTEETERKFLNRQSEKRDEDDDLDTRSLLERMKETVEDMKRRRSLNPRVSLGLVNSPSKQNTTIEDTGFSLLAPGVKKELEASLQREAKMDEDIQSNSDEFVQNHVREGDARGLNNKIGLIKTPIKPNARLETLGETDVGARTPKMNDLKHVFGAPRMAATPSFKGMKHLFPRQDARPSDTPVFEGLGEMMRTPEHYRYSGWNELGRVSEEKEDVQMEDVQQAAVIPRRRGGRTRAAAAAAAVNRPPSTEDEPESQERSVRARRGRMRSVDDDSEVKDADVVKPKGRVLRGSKKIVEENIQEEVPDNAGRPSVRRAPSSQEEANRLEQSQPASDKAVEEASNPRSNPRRGRGRTPVTAETTHEDDMEVDDLPSAAQKPSRKRTPRSNVQAQQESEPLESSGPDTTQMRSRARDADDNNPKASKSQRVTRTKAIEVDDDNDPLDSIDSPEADAHETASVVPTKAKRGTRSRTATKTVKDDESQISSKKAPGKDSAKLPSGRTGGRLRSSSAEIAVPLESVINKENTGVEEVVVLSEKATKTRVPRTRKAAAVKVEALVEDSSLDSVPGTKTRATRSRARK